MTVTCEPVSEVEAPGRLADRGMFISRQYCVCPRCETTIPADCILRHDLDEGQRDVGERRVSIYCPACFGAYTAWFSIDGGAFSRQTSPITVIRDEALIDTLRGGLERVRGDRQVRAARTPEPVPVTAESVASATLAELRDQQDRTQLHVTQAQLSMTVERELVRKLTAERRIPPNATGCAPGGRKVEVAPSPVVPAASESAALDVALAGETQGLAAETGSVRELTYERDPAPEFDYDFSGGV